MKEIICEEVYNEYYDSVGNYHWTGTVSGEHIVRVEELESRPFVQKGEDMTKEIEFPIKDQGERNPCCDCNSNSMEECLLIKHCPFWVVKKEGDK